MPMTSTDIVGFNTWGYLPTSIGVCPLRDRQLARAGQAARTRVQIAIPSAHRHSREDS